MEIPHRFENMEGIEGSAAAMKAIQKRSLADGNKRREEKRRKWKAKQARGQEQDSREKLRFSWIEENSEFSSWVTDEDAWAIRNNSTSNLLHQMMYPYIDIQDSCKRQNEKSGEEERLFVAEGTETIRILIQKANKQRPDELDPVEIKSVFVKPSVLFEEPVNLLRDIQEAAARNKQNKGHPGFHVFVGSEGTISKIAGFHVARGAMACGVVPNDRTEDWLESMIEQRMLANKKLRLLALDGICDTSNLGSMIRCASAFGIDAVIVSNDTCEAWYRRSIRVSMGHIFRVPVVRVKNLADCLRRWNRKTPSLQSYAALIDSSCLLREIPDGVKSSWCCVLGNEGTGISSAVAMSCSHSIRIDMEDEVDSLSVPIACGILLHGLRERER